VTLIGCTHSEAVSTLRAVNDDIAMLICKGFSEEHLSSDVNASIAESLVLSRPSCELVSNSSVLVRVFLLCRYLHINSCFPQLSSFLNPLILKETFEHEHSGLFSGTDEFLVTQ